MSGKMEVQAAVHIGPWGKLPWLPFEALIGLLLIINGAAALLNASPTIPDTPPVVHYLTAAAYLTGGFGIVGGLWRLNARAEIVGLMGLISAVTANTATALALGVGIPVVRGFTFIAVAWAAGIRIFELAKGRRVVQLEPPTREKP